MIVFLDAETFKTQLGLLIPPMVSLASLATDDDVRASTTPDIMHARHHRRKIKHYLKAWLEDDDVMIWGHRVAYDMAVLCNEFPDLVVPIFDKYAAGLVRDVRIRCRLADIREGTLDHGFKGLAEASRTAGRKITKYSLEGMAMRFVPGYIPHKNEWQLRFGELIDTSIGFWPSEAREYALEDPVVTRDVRRALPHEEAREEAECRGAFALHLSAAHGMRVDLERATSARHRYVDQADVAAGKLHELGLLQLKRDGKVGKVPAAIREFVERAFDEVHGVPAPRTKASKTYPEGQTSTARGVLQQVGGYPAIKELIAFNQAQHMLSTFLPPLEKAGRLGVPVTPSIEPLVNSGRPSCSKPNLYNPPKHGGIRPIMVPAPGCKFVVADYEGAELHAFAQTCLDWGIPSTMAEVINRGEDVHCRMTAELLEMDPEVVLRLYQEHEACKDAGRVPPEEAVRVAKTRSPLAKATVFGGLGGLGKATLVEFCWSWNLFISMQQAGSALAALKRAFAEIRVYFDVCDLLAKGGGTIEIPRSGFTRGRLRFTQIANTHFQTPIAHGAKDALFAVTYLAHCVPRSTLYGCRVPLFLYDEILLDAPEEQAEEAGHELCAVMETCMDVHVPDVPSKVEARIMNRWRDK
jgi:hypothetical protein